MRKATQWSLADVARVGKNADGEYILEHPSNAERLDDLIGVDGSSLHDLREGPSDVDVAELLARRQRISEMLEIAEMEGEAVHRTVLLVMLGWNYRELAAFEAVSENAIAKRLERFRRKLEALGV